MASEIEICNIALSRIGNSRSINSMTEASKEANQCSLHYEQCRDAVLSDFPWNFAVALHWLIPIIRRRNGNMHTATRRTV